MITTKSVVRGIVKYLSPVPQTLGGEGQPALNPPKVDDLGPTAHLKFRHWKVTDWLDLISDFSAGIQNRNINYSETIGDDLLIYTRRV